MKTIKQIQEENRKIICHTVGDVIWSPLTSSRVVLAANLKKKKHNHITWDLQKETLEQQAPEVQIAINQLLTK